MACELKALHHLDALYRSCKAYPGGVEALAARLAIKPSTLYSKLRQRIDTHRVGFSEELSEILFCLAEAQVPDWQAPVHALAWRHGMLAVDLPAQVLGSNEELAVLICDTVRRQGDAVAMIGRALADDNLINSRELDDIERGMEQALTAIAALRVRVRALHLDAKDRGLVR